MATQLRGVSRTFSAQFGRPEEREVHGLARKLTCAVCSATVVGVLLILLGQVLLTLAAVPEWGSKTREAMVEYEKVTMCNDSSAV